MFTHESGKAAVNHIMASVLYGQNLMFLECHFIKDSATEVKIFFTKNAFLLKLKTTTTFSFHANSSLSISIGKTFAFLSACFYNCARSLLEADCFWRSTPVLKFQN